MPGLCLACHVRHPSRPQLSPGTGLLASLLCFGLPSSVMSLQAARPADITDLKESIQGMSLIAPMGLPMCDLSR